MNTRKCLAASNAVRTRVDCNSAAHRHRGIALILCLVLLIVISLAVAMAVRRAVSGDESAQALRSRNLAFQAAETALRFCENEVLLHAGVRVGGVLRAPHPAWENGAPSLWRERAHWLETSTHSIGVSTPHGKATRSPARPDSVSPRCMVETLRLPSEEGAASQAYLVTAVGYSTDYRRPAGTGPPEGGSEVWLQSTVMR